MLPEQPSVLKDRLCAGEDFAKKNIESDLQSLMLVIRRRTHCLEKENPKFIEENLNDICASVQARIVSILLKKLKRIQVGKELSFYSIDEKEIDIPFLSIMLNVFLLIALPLSLGLWASHKFPRFASRAKKPMKYFSLGFFLFTCI